MDASINTSVAKAQDFESHSTIANQNVLIVRTNDFFSPVRTFYSYHKWMNDDVAKIGMIPLTHTGILSGQLTFYQCCRCRITYVQYDEVRRPDSPFITDLANMPTCGAMVLLV